MGKESNDAISWRKHIRREYLRIKAFKKYKRTDNIRDVWKTNRKYMNGE